MSCFQFNHNFLYRKQNQNSSKTCLRYRIDISNHIRKLTYLIMWSEKYQAKIEGTNGRKLLQTSDIQLSISLKPETQNEFHERPN